VKAAKLATEIADIFPPPWESEKKCIGDLITALFNFTAGSSASMMPHSETFDNARLDLRETQKIIAKKTGRSYWELIRDLVWLASGKMYLPLSDRTVRRYLLWPKGSLGSFWRHNSRLLRKLALLVPRGVRETTPFESVARARLNATVSRSTSKKTAQNRE
jgi:hypothetical protein